MRQGRMGPSGNRHTQEIKRAAEKLQQTQRDADLKHLLEQPEARRFFRDLIYRRCDILSTGVSPSGSEMYFFGGRRDIGIAVMQDLQRVDAQAFAKMLLEGIAETAEQRLHSESAVARADTEMDDDDEGKDD